MKKIIQASNAPAAIGPYSQAILINNTLYTSGQIPINPQTGKLCSSEIKLQTEQAIRNMENILKEAGFELTDVIRTTVFLADMKLFGEFNDTYKTYFRENAPARSCVAVNGLPMNALVEIECIASK